MYARYIILFFFLPLSPLVLVVFALLAILGISSDESSDLGVFFLFLVVFALFAVLGISSDEYSDLRVFILLLVALGFGSVIGFAFAVLAIVTATCSSQSSERLWQRRKKNIYKLPWPCNPTKPTKAS